MSNTLAVASQSGQTVTFYDVSSGNRTGHLKDLKPEPHELCFDARTNLLYLSHAYEHGWYPAHGDFGREVSVIDCVQKRVVNIIDISPTKGPHYLALDQKHDILYASVEDGISDAPNSGGIIGISLQSRKVVKAIESGYKTHWFVMTPDCRKAYTCNKEAGFISIIDLIEEKLVGKIDLPGGCEQPAISNNGKLVFFPTTAIAAGVSKKQADFCIQVVDTTLDKVVKSIPQDVGALTVHVDSQDRVLIGQSHFEISPSNNKPIFSNGKLKVLSPADGEYRELDTLGVGVGPLTIFSSRDGRRAFVSNILSGTVTVVDMTSMSVERTIEVDTAVPAEKRILQGAHGLALIP